MNTTPKRNGKKNLGVMVHLRMPAKLREDVGWEAVRQNETVTVFVNKAVAARVEALKAERREKKAGAESGSTPTVESDTAPGSEKS